MSGCTWETRFLPLVLSIDESGDVAMHVDGACAVHNDDKGHSGLFLTMGQGAMMSMSKKLGLMTTSSTETEIVADGERFPKHTLFGYFRLAKEIVIKRMC